MKHITEKQIEELREAFVRNLAVDFFEEDEIGQILQDIDSFDPLVRQKVLALCLALSHASSSLVPRVLGRIKSVSDALLPGELDLWVTTAFDQLDSQGIDSALQFLAKVTETDLKDFQTPRGLRLREVAPVLETYARGLSGRDLKLEQNAVVYTDTAAIYLPAHLTRFPERDRNFLLYKLSVAHQWARIACGTLDPEPDKALLREIVPGCLPDRPDIAKLFDCFPDRALALDLFNALESLRIDAFLRRELPGLMRSAPQALRELYDERPDLGSLSPKAAVVEALYQYALAGAVKGTAPEAFQSVLPELPALTGSTGPEASLRLLARMYEAVSSAPGDYAPLPPPVPFGRIMPEAIMRVTGESRRERKKKLDAALTKLAGLPDFPPRLPAKREAEAEQPLRSGREYLLIQGRLIEVDDDLREIIEERGGAPAGVLVDGSEMGSGAVLTVADLMAEPEEEGAPAAGGILYDEWDYRRGGYKRNWCRLHEQDVPPGHGPFVEQTLARYGGYVGILRKKFELLKREPKIQRRQREGDDVDIDAVVEAVSDMRAGLSPAENLFARLDRQERNIAVVFLVDMSGSTKGWVNTAEKESLVLMCEALETLGDRYAIYGFSGMTRNRCDLYRIKSFDETYAESVKRRIAGVEPKDYTRMGPFIRHAVKLLCGVEARTRLLITLSDGKPEDWDQYKGDYGIEDTRHALTEAREQGIHPFCITIDKEAQSYLPHMYGEANYIFIDDVRKLPGRITDIYRRLTA